MQEANQHISFLVLQEAIRQARYNALKTANAELVNLYWQAGAFVSRQLAQSQWGEKTVQQLADFLQKQEPGLKGFDKRNIYRMVEFYEKYHSSAFVVSVIPQIQSTENQLDEIVSSAKPQLEKQAESELVASLRQQILGEDIRQTILAKIGWTHNKTIFSRCKIEEEREFYIRLCIKENYSVKELDRQISAGLFERTMIGNSKLPSSLKEMHPNILNNFKDSYVFEFLNLPEPHNESDLQKGLIKQMKNFILELGKDFLFIGEEYKVQVGNRDFNIDLLFYHRGLQCLVAFELKKEKFEPEHLGKINFYLEALDRDVKKENENPSIGILLCKDKDHEVVEYALSRSLSPTMIAEYRMQLPDKKLLQQKLHQLSELGFFG
ncbi:PDDEXK nuclease domain-containing protein [Agriterribacter humi]|jgi:predicted nuclease of restriction endonuclease-like (RecB) superfamily|uniref:PDDEXK nuclease domain-containing protein n=1 Tax=Agriterribacter humi TaxID=1104781 RepID=UPI00126567F7|nr:PDDEXK nuclease domain-containing protein [Agriterribacter humi]